MTIRIEKTDGVWTVTHSQSEARNAVDPAAPTRELLDVWSFAISWVAAFTLFTVVNAPVSWWPRIDGKPG